MKAISSNIVVALLALSCVSSHAMPIFVDTEKVPLARLTTNLEARIRQTPTNVETIYALARVHSLAYAMDAHVFDVEKRNGQPFFGYFESAILPPKQVEKSPDTAKADAARQHLTNAITLYQRAVALQTNHLAAQLGLGWCLDQAGQKQAALSAYRKALTLAWAREEEQDYIFGTSLTQEIIGYMRPLQDPERDAAELKRLATYKAAIDKKGRAVTPILIPLEPGATLAELVNAQAGVPFDLDGSGIVRHWGWITPKAAWLVRDRGGRDAITSGLQMFGGVTFWIFWENGYHALAALDDNGDDVLQGSELEGLALWQDLNSNGLSEPGEVRSLAAWGITSFSCSHQVHPPGIPFNARGVTFKDGTTRPTYDWISETRR